MKRVFLGAVAALALQAASANAADVIDEAIYDWTGLYAGLNAGYAFGGDDEVAVFPGVGNVADLNLHGFFGGLQVGYNHQMDNFVLGLEGDIQASGISDDDGPASDDNTYFGTARLRAGWAIDRTLVYATGGLAFGSFDYDVKAPGAIHDTFSRVGYTLGGGLEYAFDDSWSMKVEYLYANFGKETVRGGGTWTHATPDFHSVRLGVNFKF